MKFTVKKTSDYRYSEEIKISTLAQLIQFVKDSNSDIILQHPDKNLDSEGKNLILEIYDDCRE